MDTKQSRARTIENVLESHVTVASRWNSRSFESDLKQPSYESGT